jgi:hypothetical protein
MDKGNIVCMTLLDLQKASDTVDHTIMHMKLQASAIDNDILTIGSSFIYDRQQLMDVAGTHSTTAPSIYGVSKGLILGPLYV